MRRKEQEITDRSEIEAIIKEARFCHVAMCTENIPYLVPLCFGYENNTLYFHSAREGKKIDMMKQNPTVSFAIHVSNTFIKSDQACKWGLSYKSVTGTGQVSFLEEETERTRALDSIMRQYSDEEWTYQESSLKKTAVYKIDIEEMTGKSSAE